MIVAQISNGVTGKIYSETFYSDDRKMRRALCEMARLLSKIALAHIISRVGVHATFFLEQELSLSSREFIDPIEAEQQFQIVNNCAV